MSLLIEKIDLIRYLLVLKITGPQVKLLRRSIPEFSYVLGKIMAERMAKAKSKAWWKNLTTAKEWLFSSARETRDMPETFWPIQSAWLVYTQKTRLSRGESLFLELKLFSNAAEHHFFLETVLPGLEEAGRISNHESRMKSNLAGNFEIESIYTAKKLKWEPVVKQGRLDFRAQIDSRQWAEGMDARPGKRNKPLTRLSWITPLDLDAKNGIPEQPPDMHQLIEKVLYRYKLLTSKGYTSDERFVSDFTSKETAQLQDCLEQAGNVEVRGFNQTFLKTTPPYFWLGEQYFAPVPESLVPLLELASIIHIGRYTHYGYGTFRLN